MEKMGSPTLVLNASFEPIHMVSWQRAMQLLFQGKVEVVEHSDREIRTVTVAFKIPAVLRLLKYIPLRRQEQVIRFSRANVFIRDKYTCQYCARRESKALLTLDHVIPAVQGGKKIWENIVTACRKCNQKKGGRTPSQAHMQLIAPPRRPKFLARTHLQFGIHIVPEKWKMYFR